MTFSFAILFMIYHVTLGHTLKLSRRARFQSRPDLTYLHLNAEQGKPCNRAGIETRPTVHGLSLGV